MQQNVTLTLPITQQKLPLIFVKNKVRLCVCVCVWQGSWSSLQKRGETATKVYTVSHQTSIDSIFNDPHLGIDSDI